MYTSLWRRLKKKDQISPYYFSIRVHSVQKLKYYIERVFILSFRRLTNRSHLLRFPRVYRSETKRHGKALRTVEKRRGSSVLKGKTFGKNRRRRKTPSRRSSRRERGKSLNHFSRWLHDRLHTIRVRRIAPRRRRSENRRKGAEQGEARGRRWCEGARK